MSTLVLPLGVGKTRLARRSREAVHPLFAPKRLLQLALVVLVVLPIPSDDGPPKPHAPAAAQAQAAVSVAVLRTPSRKVME